MVYVRNNNMGDSHKYNVKQTKMNTNEYTLTLYRV